MSKNKKREKKINKLNIFCCVSSFIGSFIGFIISDLLIGIIGLILGLLFLFNLDGDCYGATGVGY